MHTLSSKEVPLGSGVINFESGNRQSKIKKSRSCLLRRKFFIDVDKISFNYRN